MGNVHNLEGMPITVVYFECMDCHRVYAGTNREVAKEMSVISKGPSPDQHHFICEHCIDKRKRPDECQA